ncbi:hypothetical protein [Sinimarinibacterium sp. NLF-5-8]|uniref:hypothetical protein n=1 Tax=Sinimarinibacterium sp. NLF-5-8 TaxID=2698684 RepID=UPI00137C17D1|nr:hypothetical protein [Sinimarinibacterium sp. NLF-5-8]QHS11319.1 hypothetical protein GT972_14975 [Sinimarinibacterium sp. NLF-5-8]
MTALNLPASPRRLTCIGFDWRAEVSLRETLGLLRGRTIDTWQYSDELTADVVVYDASNTLALAMLRRSDARRQVFVASVASEDQPEALTLKYPFGASRLIACLDAASQRLAGQPAFPRAAAQSDSLCQQLYDALHTPGAKIVHIHSGAHQGWIDISKRQLFWHQRLSIDDLAQLLAADDLQIRAQTAVEARLTAYREHVAQSAEPLLWGLGITRSDNTLLRAIDAERRYRLRRWPDFGLIGRRTSDLRCTSLLMQSDLSPLELSRVSTIPLSVIGNYLNAAALCGALMPAASATATSQTPPPAEIATPRSGIFGMLSRIRSALALNLS